MAILRTLKTTFTGGVYSPAVAARVDLEKQRTGAKKGTNCFVHPHGGVSNRAGFEMVSYLHQNDMTIQIPFIASIETNETYALLFSNNRIMFTRHGSPVLETAVSGVGVSVSDIVFDKTDHGFATGDLVVWFDETNASLHSRTLVVEQEDEDYFNLRYTNDTSSKVTHTEASAGNAFTLRRRYTVETTYSENEVRQISYVQDNDVMYLAHVNHPPRKLSRRGDTDWTLEDVDFEPKMTTPTGLTMEVTHGEQHDADLEETYYYKVSAVSEETGEEGLPSASVFANNDLNIQGAKNVITWSPVNGVYKYVVYKNTDGAYGYIGSTRQTTFRDNNIVEDSADGPQDAFNPFEGEHNYPRTVTLHDQRLAFASTATDPQAVFLSQTAVLENFGAASPAKADDAITFRVRAKSRQYFYNMMTVSSGLALFSSSTEWIVKGSEGADYLTPTNAVARPQTYRGNYYLPPLEVGDVFLYAQARGGVVREFTYSFEDDKYGGADRTIMARHFFEHRRIVSWCYAQSPYSIVWVVLDNGKLLSMTYLREHDVWGWTEHETQGEFESVIALPEGDEDVVYATTKRTVNGQTVRFHERMASRRVTSKDDWFFVDCGLRYTGDPVGRISGLYHLEGMDVAVLADGNVLKGLSVTAGDIDLSVDTETYSNVVIGLAYGTDIETLDLDLGNVPEIGVIQGREVSIPEIVLNVEHTRGMWVGYDREHMNEHKQRATEDYGRAIEPFTGEFAMDTDPEYNRHGNIVIQQRDPLPMTVLSVAADVSVGG